MKKLFKITATGIILLLVFIIIYSSVSRNIPQDLKKDAIAAQEKYSEFITSKNYIIIIDYSLPIFAKRLWLYDLENDNVILNTHVTHAFKSGLVYAEEFSNTPETNLSCTGSFATQEDYHGSFGYSMRINGLENTNNNARRRTIVFHRLVSIKVMGIKLPKSIAIYSLGCFALNEIDLNEIIRRTKNGSLVFVKS